MKLRVPTRFSFQGCESYVISKLIESSCCKASKARRLEEEAITTRAGDRRGLTLLRFHLQQVVKRNSDQQSSHVMIHVSIFPPGSVADARAKNLAPDTATAPNPGMCQYS